MGLFWSLIDQPAHVAQRLLLRAEMVTQRATAAGVSRHQDFDAEPVEDARERRIGVRRQRLLAARSQRDRSRLAPVTPPSAISA